MLDVLVNDDSPMADRSLVNESLSREIDRALSTLTEREKDIIQMFFGINTQEMTLEEIGDKFGLTRERVRQIKEKAIRRLSVIKQLGLINTLWSVILPMAINVYNLVLMRNFFEGIPESLFEAAQIDGCSPMGIFFKIVLPLSKAALALMFSVGLSIGNDPQTLRNFRSLNPRLIFLPVATILGTISAAALVSLILPHRSAADCMAVGSGFGYYSLSSIFITQYKGPELGTIALLSNITREIITLLCFRSAARWRRAGRSECGLA